MAPDALTRHLRRRADYRAAFETPAGRRVLADLARFCLMDQPTFAVDPCVTAFNEGRRRVFLRIRGILRMREDEMMHLAKETDDD